jgi:anti-sigma factor RsiW
MDCRHFRRAHTDFVDGLLTEKQTGEMHEHLQGCARCARLDTAIRRGLLVARNLPPIRPSRDFGSRLEARLREPVQPIRERRYPPLFTSLGVGVALVAVIVAAVKTGREQVATTPSTVAQQVHPNPAPPAPPQASAEFMASLAAGIPVWSGVSIADRAAAHLAEVELQQASTSP